MNAMEKFIEALKNDEALLAEVESVDSAEELHKIAEPYGVTLEEVQAVLEQM